jgi:hypothetical protein
MLPEHERLIEFCMALKSAASSSPKEVATEYLKTKPPEFNNNSPFPKGTVR